MDGTAVTGHHDLHPLERMLLSFLDRRGSSSDVEVIAGSELPDEGSFRRASEWLLSRGLIREVSRSGRTQVGLGPLGEDSLAAGTTPELALAAAVATGVSDLASVQEDPAFEKARWGSALGALVKAGVVGKTPEGGLTCVHPLGGVFRGVWDLVYTPLSLGREVVFGDLPADIAELVDSRSPRRGKSRAEFVLDQTVTRILDITEEGREAIRRDRDVLTIGAMTPEVLSDGSWRNAGFRRYRLDMPPARLHLGRLHPYRQFLDTVRRRFTGMGFREMKGSLAENEFWNNDALFMPQFHPARDIHDAYCLEAGVSVPKPDPAVAARVAAAHEDGRGTGGRGWGYDFSMERSFQAILRSQGTALSARTLASGPDVPGKYFGIARCFRYDQVDATHLPDFFQIEGIVLGEGINLRHLLGLLKLFAEEIAGAEEYKFLPAYFPFTEPSVELHIRHPRLGWIEGGGAGLFRPEVCLPLGIEVPVIAWGLGLDRMAMLALGLSDIRDLVTPDLARLREMRVLPDRLLQGKGAAHA
jgi:phenylalanyl-tRNA synthetase alpha chain